MASLTIDPGQIATKLGITAEEAEQLIDGAIARAAIVAPCLLEDNLSAQAVAAATDIIVTSLVRRQQYGTGVVTQQQAGPLTERVQGSRGLFWPEEIHDLQGLCRRARGTGRPRGQFPPPLDYDRVLARP